MSIASSVHRGDASRNRPNRSSGSPDKELNEKRAMSWNAKEAAAMTVTRQSLLERFQLLSDEELLALFRSGDLIELAKDVAAKELQQRGVDLSKPAAALPADSEESSGNGDEGTSVSGDLVLIARLFTALDAHLLQSRLEAEGVPTVVVDDNIVQTNPFLTMAVGGVRVLVPESQAVRAREIARDVERGDYALDDQKGSE
jgi:hypothetical protein